MIWFIVRYTNQFISQCNFPFLVPFQYCAFYVYWLHITAVLYGCTLITFWLYRNKAILVRCENISCPLTISKNLLVLKNGLFIWSFKCKSSVFVISLSGDVCHCITVRLKSNYVFSLVVSIICNVETCIHHNINLLTVYYNLPSFFQIVTLCVGIAVLVVSLPTLFLFNRRASILFLAE